MIKCGNPLKNCDGFAHVVRLSTFIPYNETSVSPVHNAQVCVFDGTMSINPTLANEVETLMMNFTTVI